MTAPGYVWFISDLSVDLNICCGRHVAAAWNRSTIRPCCPDARIVATALLIQDAEEVRVMRRGVKGLRHH